MVSWCFPKHAGFAKISVISLSPHPGTWDWHSEGQELYTKSKMRMWYKLGEEFQGWHWLPHWDQILNHLYLKDRGDNTLKIQIMLFPKLRSWKQTSPKHHQKYHRNPKNKVVTFNKILAVKASAFQPWLLPSPLLRALQVAAPQVVFPVGVKPRFPRGKGPKCEQKKTIVTNTNPGSPKASL